MRVYSVAGLAALALAVGACSPFTPDLPPEPFLCGSGTPACPDGYSCMQEGTQNVCVDMTGVTSDGSVVDGNPIDAPNTCAHDLCTVGDKLDSSCDSCVSQICATDDYCCMTKWSSQCVDEVSSICHQSTCP